IIHSDTTCTFLFVFVFFSFFYIFFFFTATAPSEIYTLSLHDALPIFSPPVSLWLPEFWPSHIAASAARTRSHESWYCGKGRTTPDRKSTRLNSSHSQISYAVFCLKKKKKKTKTIQDDNLVIYAEPSYAHNYGITRAGRYLAVDRLDASCFTGRVAARRTDPSCRLL